MSMIWRCAIISQRVLLALLSFFAASPLHAQAEKQPDWLSLQRQVLPPALAWEGSSRSLALRQGDAWVTPCESNDLRTTPRYDETMAWLDSLCDATPLAQMRSIGVSNEGRTIWMVVVTTAAEFSGDALRESGKPTLLAQGGIHSGEIDGKDAGMMLLRDLTVRGNLRELLDKANLLFIPILNVDGHERFTEYGRINQRGPEQMGWRTNANNLNLNRDYAKLDTPGVRAVVQVLNEYTVDLYLDLHVTDGADYQYDITWGGNGPAAYSPAIESWYGSVLNPQLQNDLRQQGHIPGPLIFAIEGRDMNRGILNWTSSPRFSTGYGDARHLPTILVENHSLKPYDQRVLGTRVFLESTMRVLGQSARDLRKAVEKDRAQRQDPVVLDLAVGPGPHATFEFLGVESTPQRSAVSGDLYVKFDGKKETLALPYPARTSLKDSVVRPAAYWVPATWREVIERLQLHGIRMDISTQEVEQEVEMYRLVHPELATATFEGHVRVTAERAPEIRMQRFPAGSARIDMDQPLGTLAALLLEPQAPDSFFQWGFFHAILQRTEYSEAYVTEPLAERMLADDADLRRQFEQKLVSDPVFAADPEARRDFFYARTPWFDDHWNLYPVAREMP